jgi:hypothetical protein
MSAPLIWEIVKKHNCFIRKSGNTPDKKGVTTFSAESGNLTNKNSYKFSGIANAKGITFQTIAGKVAGKDDKIILKLKVDCVLLETYNAHDMTSVLTLADREECEQAEEVVRVGAPPL